MKTKWKISSSTAIARFSPSLSIFTWFLQCVCNQYFHALLSQQFCLHGLWECDELLYLHENWKFIRKIRGNLKKNKVNYRKIILILFVLTYKFKTKFIMFFLKIQHMPFKWWKFNHCHFHGSSFSSFTAL